MPLHSAHSGYIYQDLLTTYYILKEILEERASVIHVDRKHVIDDRFDDIVIERNEAIFRKQVKYSDGKKRHILQKSDLSSDANYNLALHSLYHCWEKYPTNEHNEIRICLGWSLPAPEDELWNILLPLDDYRTFQEHSTSVFKIDVDVLWDEKTGPLPSWRKFSHESASIKRVKFCNFLDHLLIEVNFPKASLDIDRPGELERIVLQQTERLGLGEYPNEDVSPKETILYLTHLVQKARADSQQLALNDLFKRLGIRTDFGRVKQVFPVRDEELIETTDTVDLVRNIIQNHNKIILSGEPGAGKSWLIHNLERALGDEFVFVKHYCYTDLHDEFQVERIKENTLYGNLISDILIAFPELKERKQKKYASNLNELNLLLKHIQKPTLLIVDGLDHINRVYQLKGKLIAKGDVDILQAIKRIDLSNENVTCLVFSQPIEELHGLGSFFREALPQWSEEDVEELMGRYGILNQHFTDKRNLSEHLLEKSNGNALYLTYLMKELKRKKSVTLDVLDTLPVYSYNLREYYEYLLSQLDESGQVPQILSGADFRLSKEELVSITNRGNYVEKDLSVLSPVLNLNHAHGGYSMYHESFRRFIIERLEDNNVPVQATIYRPLSEWLSEKGFFTFNKATRYYFSSLLQQGEENTLLDYLIPNFVRECLYHGHSWETIKKNYKLLLQAATKKQRFDKLIILIELGRMLSSTEDNYMQSYELYFMALGAVHGFDVAVQTLVFEGNPTIEEKLGLKACRICEYNGVSAPWGVYLRSYKKGDPISLDAFRYYLTYLLCQRRYDDVAEYAKKVFKYPEFLFVFKDEVSSWNAHLHDDVWVDDYATIKKALTYKKKKKHKYELDELVQKILQFEYVYEEQEEVLLAYYVEVERLFSIGEGEKVRTSIQPLKAHNWFYNWIIYYTELKGIFSRNEYSFNDVKGAFDYLLYDTEPFKGKPRTCDLYHIRDLIFISFEEGVALLQNEEERNEVVHLLQQVSYKTTTYLMGLVGESTGPLPRRMLLEIVRKHCSEKHLSHAVKVFEEEIKKGECNDYYYAIADQHFKLTQLYATQGETDKSKEAFQKAIQNLVGYSFRKDVTLDELLDSLNSIHHIAPDLGVEYARKLKILAETVVNHTDGKSTKHFPITWFKKYCRIEPKNSLIYLVTQLLETRINWKLEDSLVYFLTKSKGRVNPLIELLLSRTFPGEGSEEFLQNCLVLLSMLKDGEPALVKRYFGVVSSKLYIGRDDTYSQEFLDLLESYGQEIGVEISVGEKNNKNTIDTTSQSKNDIEEIIRSSFSVRSSEFSKMSVPEIISYVENETLQESDAMGLLFRLQELEEESKRLVVRALAQKDHFYLDRKYEWIDKIFCSETTLSVYYLVSAFVFQKGGWFEGLENIPVFEKAYKIAPTKALSHLSELLSMVFKNISWNSGYSANLINAFVKVGLPASEILPLWENLYQVIDSRLPGKDGFNWEAVLLSDLQDFSEEELLVCLLFTRFKSHASERHYWTLAGLAFLLERQPHIVIKPIAWFLKHTDGFLEIPLLSVLQLLYEKHKENPYYSSNFCEELGELYPTNFFLSDWLLEQLLKLPSRKKLLVDSQIFYELPREGVEFYLNLNRRNYTLNRWGFDLGNVFGEYYHSIKRKYRDELEIYHSRSTKRMLPNLYMPNYMLKLINTRFYNALRTFGNHHNYQVYDDIKLHDKALIAQIQATSNRPRKLVTPKEVNSGSSILDCLPIFNGWVRVGSFEEQYYRNDFREEYQKFTLFGGMVVDDDREEEFPYSSYEFTPSWLWEKEFPTLEFEGAFIVSNIQRDDHYENLKLLWLHPELFKFLNLKTLSYLQGFVAVDSNGEIALKYNAWLSEYMGGDFDQEVPKLNGAELLLRKDCFEKISESYNIASPKYLLYRKKE